VTPSGAVHLLVILYRFAYKINSKGLALGSQNPSSPFRIYNLSRVARSTAPAPLR